MIVSSLEAWYDGRGGSSGIEDVGGESRAGFYPVEQKDQDVHDRSAFAFFAKHQPEQRE